MKNGTWKEKKCLSSVARERRVHADDRRKIGTRASTAGGSGRRHRIVEGVVGPLLGVILAHECHANHKNKETARPAAQVWKPRQLRRGRWKDVERDIGRRGEGAVHLQQAAPALLLVGEPAGGRGKGDWRAALGRRCVITGMKELLRSPWEINATF